MSTHATGNKLYILKKQQGKCSSRSSIANTISAVASAIACIAALWSIMISTETLREEKSKNEIENSSLLNIPLFIVRGKVYDSKNLKVYMFDENDSKNKVVINNTGNANATNVSVDFIISKEHTDLVNNFLMNNNVNTSIEFSSDTNYLKGENNKHYYKVFRTKVERVDGTMREHYSDTYYAYEIPYISKDDKVTMRIPYNVNIFANALGNIVHNFNKKFDFNVLSGMPVIVKITQTSPAQKQSVHTFEAYFQYIVIDKEKLTYTAYIKTYVQ